MKRQLRQRDIAVLVTLAAVDMDHPALTVDIGDFDIKAFVKPQGVLGAQDRENVPVAVERRGV